MNKKLNQFFKLRFSLMFSIFALLLFSSSMSSEFNNYVFAQNEPSENFDDTEVSNTEVNAQGLDSFQEANLAFSYQYPANISESYAQLESMVEQQGKVRVILELDIPVVPEGELDGPQAIQNQQQMIQSAQQNFLKQLSGSTVLSPDTYQFKHVPFISTVIDTSSLSVLQSSPMISSIMPDVAVPPLLIDSNSIIGADEVWSPTFENVGYTGAGQQVVVLDTGVDKNHPFLAGKVVSEACYSSTIASDSSTSLCPGGVSESTAIDSGLPCPSSISGCDHGTHVAGIAAGDTFQYVGNEYHGVARDAQVIPIKVFSQFNDPSNCLFQTPCVLSYTSDQMKALERVLELHQNDPSLNIASINMSLGGGQFNTFCDNQPLKPIIDQLKSVGIATIIASGNNGFSNSISAPACISSAISVGSTTKTDSVSSFSNSAAIVDLLAPGSNIISSILNDGFAAKSGTSMSTPHVAGAWALTKEKAPNATVQETLDVLKNNGTLILDNRNGLSIPRIQLDDAVHVIPEFGTVAIMILTVAIISIVAVTAKSRIVPRF